MATVKLGTLLIRTVAKPISTLLKQRAEGHPKFRGFCVELAQKMYRAELKLRTRILGQPAKHVRPLSETRAIENGANALAEGFLFSVAAMLIVGETWRSSRSESRRRDDAAKRLADVENRIGELGAQTERLAQTLEEKWLAERERNVELRRVLERVVQIGLHSSWSALEDTGLAVPRIRLPPRLISDSNDGLVANSAPVSPQVDSSDSAPVSPRPDSSDSRSEIIDAQH